VLTNVLLGELLPESAIYAVEELPGLHLLPPGPPPPNPAELLDSVRARDLIAALAGRYDTVVIDSPPLLPVTDAQVLSRAVDAVLLVVAHRESSRRGLHRAVELLGQVDAPVVGTVLNLVPASEGYGGAPYRYETYKSRSERRRRREAPGAAVAVPPGHLTRPGAPAHSAPVPVPPMSVPPPPGPIETIEPAEGTEAAETKR
jgi:Mrp family chromosome partitioning ATPase